MTHTRFINGLVGIGMAAAFLPFMAHAAPVKQAHTIFPHKTFLSAESFHATSSTPIRVYLLSFSLTANDEDVYLPRTLSRGARTEEKAGGVSYEFAEAVRGISGGFLYSKAAKAIDGSYRIPHGTSAEFTAVIAERPFVATSTDENRAMLTGITYRVASTTTMLVPDRYGFEKYHSRWQAF